MLRMRAAPFAVLLQFNFARDKLAVFARPVINPITLRTRYSNELVLRHVRFCYERSELVNLTPLH